MNDKVLPKASLYPLLSPLSSLPSSLSVSLSLCLTLESDVLIS